MGGGGGGNISSGEGASFVGGGGPVALTKIEPLESLEMHLKLIIVKRYIVVNLYQVNCVISIKSSKLSC